MKLSFFIRAVDQSEYWSELPPGASRAFGIYVICDGEATHCCSLTPSSWAVNIENYFAALPGQEETLRAALDSGSWAGAPCEGLEDCYLSFRSHDPANPYHSELIEFETDEPDTEEARKILWEDAVEYFSGNSRVPEACWHAERLPA